MDVDEKRERNVKYECECEWKRDRYFKVVPLDVSETEKNLGTSETEDLGRERMLGEEKEVLEMGVSD